MTCPTCSWCTNPGRCCTGFTLHRGGAGASAEHPLEIYAWLASVRHSDDAMGDTGVPFMPLYRAPEGHWRYWCPRLGRDGRCTDYDNRPKLCRLYEPLEDRLCALHAPPHRAPARSPTELRPTLAVLGKITRQDQHAPPPPETPACCPPN